MRACACACQRLTISCYQSDADWVNLEKLSCNLHGDGSEGKGYSGVAGCNATPHASTVKGTNYL